MDYCAYYQATIDKKQTWFLVATLRSFENLCFDRAFDAHNCIFEFYVPKDLEQDFLKIMQYYQDKAIVSNLQKLPNRLKSASVI